MKNQSINGAGFKGINTDLAPWELEPEVISEGINFRNDGNRIVSVGAHSVLATPPGDINAGFIMPVNTATAQFWLVAGRNAVWVYDGSTWDDISSGAYTGITGAGELNWSGCMLGKIPIINI